MRSVASCRLSGERGLQATDDPFQLGDVVFSEVESTLQATMHLGMPRTRWRASLRSSRTSRTSSRRCGWSTCGGCYDR